MQSYRLSWALLSLSFLACKSAGNTDTAKITTDTTAGTDVSRAKTDTATPNRGTTGNAKIDDALSAAPSAVAEHATVMDWPDSAGGQPKELRRGTNEWTCYPSSPAASGAAGKDPMCLDQEFVRWGEAWMNRKPPQVKGIGVGYMLRGDVGASNVDPFATAPTADNQWVRTGPHLMMVTPNAAQLATISTDPTNGGPWVMWKGTPYAHVMVPVR